MGKEQKNSTPLGGARTGRGEQGGDVVTTSLRKTMRGKRWIGCGGKNYERSVDSKGGKDKSKSPQPFSIGKKGRGGKGGMNFRKEKVSVKKTLP